MALRTTPDKVRSILENGASLDDPAINGFIEIANTLIDSTLSESGLLDGIKAEIERWYTAHLITITRLRMASDEKVDDVSIKYVGTFGAGLDSTPYGQMVKEIDSSGLMANLGKKNASIYAVKNFE